ncbi:hypothetical protein GQX74_005315 [Glossina fuscipes]|nr:hypothetical protein GQX74_005315 [Glossina fuscipes]
MKISYKNFINQSIGLNGYLVDHVKDFSCGPLHYKTFYFDENTNALYVGAMRTVGKLHSAPATLMCCQFALSPASSHFMLNFLDLFLTFYDNHVEEKTQHFFRSTNY